MQFFPQLTRAPDRVFAATQHEIAPLQPNARGQWQGAGVVVSTVERADSLFITLQSAVPVRGLKLRWDGAPPAGARVVGDAWERGYGDLEWRGLVPERVLPWYFLMFDGQQTLGAGVATGASAFCHWSVDGGGVSLHLDVRCGSAGVQLGERALDVAAVLGVRGEHPFATAQQLCRALCRAPRLPKQPVYGGNDWYYAYGHNSRDSIVRDAATMNELAPGGANRPFMVIDDGWQQPAPPSNGGPWLPNASFGDMAEVAAAIKARGARPGLWFRPLLSALDVPDSWRFGAREQTPPEGRAPAGLPLDPSVPEVLQLVADDVRRFRDWGFELVKHDFSTYDIFWKWGFEWRNQLFDASDVAATSWSFADRTRTSAEILTAFYGAMRAAAGEEMMLLGCNTVGHLGAEHFEIQRTGDDTSGREWERTRKMGINTLAFRQCQHDAFFAVDADCVGLTNRIPWELNRQWLDLLARSGTPLFVSADPAALGAPQKAALRQAFARASTPQSVAEPLDWLDTTCPSRWQSGDEVLVYDWFGAAG